MFDHFYFHYISDKFVSVVLSIFKLLCYLLRIIYQLWESTKEVQLINIIDAKNDQLIKRLRKTIDN